MPTHFSRLLLRSATLLCATSTACDEWPRHAHLPAVSQSALPAGADPSNGVTVNWHEPQTETEPNDTPSETTAIDLGEGWDLEGSLTGIGWDPEAEATSVSSCGDALAFPPAQPGNYTGDVDWLTLHTSDAGALCVDMVTDAIDARVDLTMYVLDECNEPVQVFVHADGISPIGVDQDAAHVRWAIPVDADMPLGIALAGFWPDDQEASLNWSLEVALVPSTNGADTDTLCPSGASQ